jgi:flagellar biosynthesis protein FlhG
VISITSGKGGVGKTNLAVNLALAAQDLGLRPLVFDADLGLANIDIVLGMLPQYNLMHVLRGEKTIREVICQGPRDLPIIAGGSGVTELVNLAEWQLAKFINGLNDLEGLADLVLIDTGAGLSHTVMSFLYAANEVLVVTTPEPTSITDAYAIIKLLSRRKDCLVRVVVNRAQSQWEAEATYEKMSKAANRFLGFPISFLGWLPDDPAVIQAVKRQRPFVLDYAACPAAEAVRLIAAELFSGGESAKAESGVKAFFTRLAKFLGS